MNAENIESKFAVMGACLKVREIASRWRRGDRTWIEPTDFAVDIMNTETQSRTMANVAFLD